MKIEVIRYWFTSVSTCGQLSFDGVFIAYTLQPPKGPKLMPAGIYVCKKERTFAPHIIDTLARIGLPPITPHLKDVPGWDNEGPHGPLEIHPGNIPEQTSGCTLVGLTHDINFVGRSDDAFAQLMQKLPDSFVIQYSDVQQGVTDAEIGM